MRMKQKKFIVGTMAIVIAVGYLIYTGIQETKVYYFTADEFLVKRQELADEDIRVAGRVKGGSIDWNPRTLQLSFVLGPIEASSRDDNATVEGIPVSYKGILPDMFAEGRDVIVEGLYTEKERLVASTIMTSCPSKYEPDIESQLRTS